MVLDKRKWRVTRRSSSSFLTCCLLMVIVSVNWQASAIGVTRLLNNLQREEMTVSKAQQGLLNQSAIFNNNQLFVNPKDCIDIYAIFKGNGSESCEITFGDYRDAQEWIDNCYGCRYLVFKIKIEDQMNENYKNMQLQIIVSFISAFFLAFVGFFILLNNKFKKHPYPIIGMALIFQAMLLQGQYGLYLIFPYKLPQFTSIYMYAGNLFKLKHFGYHWNNLVQMKVGDLNTLSQQGLYQTVVYQIGLWKTLFYVGTIFQITFNTMVFIDLWLALRNPFYPRRKRNKYYNTAFVIVAIYLAIILVKNQMEQGTTLDLYDFKNDSEGFILGYQYFFILLLISVSVPMFMIIRILCRRGTSRDLRLKIFKYQICYFFLFVITIFSASYDMWEIDIYDMAAQDDNGSLDWLQSIFDTLFNIVGLLMALNRLFEPYVWREFEYQGYVLAEKCIRLLYRIKVFFDQICCRKREMVHSGSFIVDIRSKEQEVGQKTDKQKNKRKKYDYSQDTLDSFLNSAMNIEMVYLILLGISNFMESTSYNKVAQEQLELSVRSENVLSSNHQKKQLVGFGNNKMNDANEMLDSKKQLVQKYNLEFNRQMTDRSNKDKSGINQKKKNHNKKKIEIKKDSNETKITFFNVKFQNVDLWNIENRSVSLAISASDFESEDRSQNMQFNPGYAPSPSGTISNKHDHDGFIIPVVSEDLSFDQQNNLQVPKLSASQQYEQEQNEQKSPAFGRFLGDSQSNKDQDSSIKKKTPTEYLQVQMDKQFLMSFDENKQDARFSNSNQSLTLSQSFLKPPQTQLLRTQDHKGNTFHIVKQSIQHDSRSALLVVENVMDKSGADKDNRSVSIRYQRRPKNILVSAKKHEQQGHYETDRGGKLNKVVKHSVLLQQMEPDNKIDRVKSFNTNLPTESHDGSQDEPSVEVVSDNSGAFFGQRKVQKKIHKVDTKQSVQQKKKKKENKKRVKNNELSMSVKSSISSYEDAKFAQIMYMDNIKPEDVISSLSMELNRNMVFKAGEGVGQSGSFFFFSHDDRFLIKTLRGKEKRNMLNILDDYIDHLKMTENRSLLARIYGVFTIKTNYFTSLDVIIMENTSRMTNKNNKKMTFDLKGSTQGRLTGFPSEERKFWRKNDFNQKRVMKDKNFMEINKDLSGQLMKLSKQQFDLLDWLIKIDSQFLRDHNLMDYSVLLVIEEVQIEPEDAIKQKTKEFNKKYYNNDLTVIDETILLKESDNTPLGEFQEMKKSSMNSTIQGDYIQVEVEEDEEKNEKTNSTQKQKFLDLNYNYKPSITSDDSKMLVISKKMHDNAVNRNQFKSIMREYKDTNLLTRMNTSMLGHRESTTNKRNPSFVSGNNIYRSQGSSISQSQISMVSKRKTCHYYQIYHVGIIDYLQEWSIPKQFENKVKVFYNKKNRHSISAVHPKKYQERFYDFMSSNMTKPAYENFKTNVGYVEACERFIELLIAKLRVYELTQAGMALHSCIRKSGALTPYDIPTDANEELVVQSFEGSEQQSNQSRSPKNNTKLRKQSNASNSSSQQPFMRFSNNLNQRMSSASQQVGNGNQPQERTFSTGVFGAVTTQLNLHDRTESQNVQRQNKLLSIDQSYQLKLKHIESEEIFGTGISSQTMDATPNTQKLAANANNEPAEGGSGSKNDNEKDIDQQP